MSEEQTPEQTTPSEHPDTPPTPARPRRWWPLIATLCLLCLALAGSAYWWFTRPRIDVAALPGRFVCALEVGDATAFNANRYAVYGMPAHGDALHRLLPFGENVKCIPNKKAVIVTVSDDTSRTSPRGFMLPPEQTWAMINPDGSKREALDAEVAPYEWPEPAEYAQVGASAPDLQFQRAAFAVTHHGTTDIMVLTMGGRIIPLTKNPFGKPEQQAGGTDGLSSGFSMGNGAPVIRCWNPLFSPDNAHVIYLKSTGGDTPSICIIGVEERKERAIVEGGSPTFHPNGKSIAYVAKAPDTDRAIYRIDIDGTNQQLLAKDAGHPAFSPDGQYIAYVRSIEEQEYLYVMKADGTAATRLLSLPHPLSSLTWVTD